MSCSKICPTFNLALKPTTTFKPIFKNISGELLALKRSSLQLDRLAIKGYLPVQTKATFQHSGAKGRMGKSTRSDMHCTALHTFQFSLLLLLLIIIYSLQFAMLSLKSGCTIRIVLQQLHGWRRKGVREMKSSAMESIKYAIKYARKTQQTSCRNR